MVQKEYEAKMREILDREVNTDEDCIRQVDELMMLDAQYLLSNLSRVFSSTTVKKHHFFGVQPPLWFNSHICT